MKTVCSFCNATISHGTTEDDPVSHGVCDDCYRQILIHHGFHIRKFLNLLDAPVFLVDAEVNVLAANRRALDLAGKPASRIQGTLCGDVLDCLNAARQDGCGKTEFCPDCRFRSSVQETYTTGQAISRRPAILTRKSGDRTEEIPFLVSTRKDGEVVLMRLELAKDNSVPESGIPGPVR